MIASLKDVMAFILERYPAHLAHELSNAKVTKMIYLADWHFAIHHKKQITDINWYFDTYGPFVKDVEKTALENKDIFVVDFGNNRYGSPKKTLSLRDPKHVTNLKPELCESLKCVISVSKDKQWDSFIKMVYSSFPVRNSERYTFLDLKSLAKDFRKEREMLERTQ